MSQTPAKGHLTPDEELGQIILRRGFVTSEQLKEALAEQAREVVSGRPRPRPLANILLSKGHLTLDQLAAARQGAHAGAARYSVQEEIARGGMGMILRAEDQDLRRSVAMKRMLGGADERSRLRFLEEAQVTGQLEHPNIVPVHELAVDSEGRPFFTMKLVKGRSLAESLKRLRGVPEKSDRDPTLVKLLGIFIDVCNAIAFAHSKGVVHRDLKPANIMLGDYGEVLVMDWGLAKVGAALKPPGGRESLDTPGLGRSPDEKMEARVISLRQETPGSLTVDGAIMGTPHYMSPEQAEGEIASIDERTDVYSLGAILYELLTLKPPVEGKSIQELLLNVAEGKIVPPENRAPDRPVPRELSAVAMKALARSPDERYPNAELLRRDIELFLENRAVSAKPDTPWETLKKLVRRNKGTAVSTAVAGALLLAVVGAGSWINLRARRTAEAERAEAERALSLFRNEQEAKRQLQRASAPVLEKAGRLALAQKQWSEALDRALAAASFDTELAGPRLLRGEALVALRRYAEAELVLREYLRGKPMDDYAASLADLCRRASTADVRSAEMDGAFVGLFTSRGEYALAESHASSARELLAAYNRRIADAWPKLGSRIQMDKDGKLALDVRNFGLGTLAPLSGIPLWSLSLQGTDITDLGPLRGLPLAKLAVKFANISDLSPLAGMPLRVLSLEHVRIGDLSPLRGMPLEFILLNNYDQGIRDYSPLRGMPLVSVEMDGGFNDLSVFEGAPLRRLVVIGSKVTDLSPVRGCPLEELQVANCRVRSLAPLKGSKLKKLNLHDTDIEDLTPLEGVPLEEIYFDPLRIAQGLGLIRHMSSIKVMGSHSGERVNPGEFWARTEGRLREPIGTWKVLGPMPAFAPPPFPPGEAIPSDSAPVPAGIPARWFNVASSGKSGGVDLARVIGRLDDVSCFAFAEITASEDRDVTLLGGSDDSIAIWLNGSLVLEERKTRKYAPDDFSAKARLKKGRNLVVVRCDNKGGEWMFSLGVAK